MHGTAPHGPRVLAALLLLAGLLLLPAAPALAHAVLVRADPPAGAVLASAPERVQAWFSEPVESAFVPLEVRDASGARADRGNARVNPADRTAVQVDLPPLPEGFYTVIYRVISADGHPVQGALGFSVGAAPAPGAAPAAAPPPGRVDPVAAGARGVDLGATLALAGLAAFGLLVWRLPAPAFGRVAGVLFLLSVAAATAYLLSFTRQVAGGLGPVLVLRAALLTQPGRLTLLRLLLAAATWLLLVLSGRPGRGGRGGAGTGALLAGAGALLLFSLNSHAAAQQARNILAVPLDWLHLLAAAAWVGGLVAFAWPVPGALAGLASKDRAARLGALVRRFSVVAMAGAALVVLTGVLAARPHIPSPAGLLTTTYGRALLVKVALLLPLLGLGLANQRHFAPGRPGDPRRFRALVVAEVALVAALLLAAGVLSSVAPARVELAARQGPFVAEQPAGDLRIGLRVDPARVGFNTGTVTVLDGAGRPVEGARVELRVRMVAHDMGRQDPVGQPAGDGRYLFQEVILGMGGEWSVEVVVLRDRGGETRVPFAVQVPEPVP